MPDRISRDESYARVVRAIADDKGLVMSGIEGREDLRSDLHFSTDGIRRLTRTLNTAHSDVALHLHGQDVEGCRTVRDLARATWEHIPDEKKIS